MSNSGPVQFESFNTGQVLTFFVSNFVLSINMWSINGQLMIMPANFCILYSALLETMLGASQLTLAKNVQKHGMVYFPTLGWLFLMFHQAICEQTWGLVYPWYSVCILIKDTLHYLPECHHPQLFHCWSFGFRLRCRQPETWVQESKLWPGTSGSWNVLFTQVLNISNQSSLMTLNRVTWLSPERFKT